MNQLAVIVILLLYILYYRVTMRNVVVKPGTPAIISVDAADFSDVVIASTVNEPTFFPDGYSVYVKFPKH
jgi:hypothetical protein